MPGVNNKFLRSEAGVRDLLVISEERIEFFYSLINRIMIGKVDVARNSYEKDRDVVERWGKQKDMDRLNEYGSCMDVMDASESDKIMYLRLEGS